VARRFPSRSVVAGLVVAVSLGLGGCGSTDTERPVADVSVHDTDNLHGNVLSDAYQVAHASLHDTSGTPYDLASDARKPLTLVFFGYTHCPDICQEVMGDIASALVRLDREKRSKIDMLFVTTDPARDTATVLRSYLDRFDPEFEGLTGRLSAIKRLGRSLGVPVEHGRRLPSGGYDIAHGTQVLGVLPSRSSATAGYVWTQGTSPADLADDLTTILEGKARIR
jgi:protein SCO1/2